MKKVLVSGYIGFDNFGDEAIFYALNYHLKALKFDVSVLCNNPDIVAKKYDVKTYYFKNIFKIISAVLNCDVLISGGGSLLQNKTSNFSLYYYLFIILIAKLCFKKVIIFSQGIEPIKGKIHTLFTKLVLKTVDYITVRDLKSQQYLKKMNLKSDLTSDPVYSLVECYKVSDSKEGLIVQLRDFKGFDELFLKDLAFSIKENYKGDIKVLSLQNSVDEKVCLKFIEYLKTFKIEAKYLPFENLDKTFEMINASKYVISTRLHGLIISNALKTNTFALIYDEKVKTLSDELELKNIDLRNYNKDELNSKLKAFFDENRINVSYRKFDWSLTDKKILDK